MFKRILPHACVVLSTIFLVLWVLDRFNAAMHFLSRDVFKIPFLVFLLLVMILSISEIVRQFREDGRR